ncbi:MAG: PolC-type DNA polymerase III [Lachnospiraceae bacterium]|nr:PolC-type DNA polymerase III [Lachnospiraceae bacterium]
MRFFEVFYSVNVDAKLKKKFEDVEVEKLLASNTNNHMCVKLASPSYIGLETINEMENILYRQVFSKAGKNVRLNVRYSFAEGMSFDEIWNKYHVYIEDELALKSPVIATLYRNSRVTASEGEITIDMPDGGISSAKEPQLVSMMNSMWKDRFGLDVAVKVTYHEVKEREVEDEYVSGFIGSAAADSEAQKLEGNEGLRESAAERHEESAGAGKDSAVKSDKGTDKANDKSSDKTPAGKDSGKGTDKKSAGGKDFGKDKDGRKGAYDKFRSGFKKKIVSDDPDVFYGRECEGDPVKISEISNEPGEVVIQGMVLRYEDRETKTGKLMVTVSITDFTDTIGAKVFLSDEDKETLPPKLKEGKFLKIKGIAETDTWPKDPWYGDMVIGKITGIKEISDFRVKRMDNAPVKRIELHAHTNMSDMDGVIDAGDLVKTAFKWGHKGVAITDHGVVQSFPVAYHYLTNPKNFKTPEEQQRAKEFKVIYGCEGYIVDDEVDSVEYKNKTFTKGPDGRYSVDDIRKMPSHHIILLCKNDVGRINLYRLVSEAHLTYFGRWPRIPKSLLRRYREGIIVGSACEAGELYRAIVNEKPEEEIDRIASFYDYYEIQQIGNNAFMLLDEDFPNIETEADLKRINKRISELADRDGKMCIATCDVHYLNPEDEVYRRIIMSAKGFKDADKQAPLYLHTTEEMLEECAFLGKEKAYEVVVENPNKIFDMIEYITPVRPDKAPPVIEDSDKTLRQICERRAHELYGPELPKPVSDRLEHELKSIIKNGFAVMYIIAQKLVWKSNEDGYLVGSRGSVGSSFAATMSGITEINPLPPHYYCKKCHYSDFDSDVCKEYEAKSGCDMPDAVCPVCGEPLTKEGHNIPFETFLGFYGDKEPDIDLNFSGEYQSKAHDYTEVIFGYGQTFRAGTIGALADKTAFGYVSKYDEEHGIKHRVVEKERIAAGCVGIRRTTGQHPGGIVVLPVGENIYSFTPVQHPANDMETLTVTTHFDYHSIDHNLLKLDILGHDDPTMIRMLEDLTGLDAKTIPMDDPGVISLFKSCDALGVKPSDIDDVELGSLGLPELGTDFVMQMLKDTKPSCFSDMVKIAGLSHGTDVWLNNAQYYIQNGDCTLSTAICTRDDIMIYLISKGLEPGLAFKTMESVRKGKGLNPDMEQAMIDHEVPQWYIDSCKKIKYMFPKAHACAYMMMAFRIAYFKIYYPLAYYAAYFSIRAADFDCAKMCGGKEHLVECMKALKRKKAEGTLTAKEDGEYDDMRSVLEFYARGLEFMPIDIYKVKARHFQIFDNKLMPSLSSVSGLGDKAAEQICDAAARGQFLSLDDFKKRCKVGDTVVQTLTELGVLAGLPESNQMSLEDFFGKGTLL